MNDTENGLKKFIEWMEKIRYKEDRMRWSTAIAKAKEMLAQLALSHAQDFNNK